MVKKHWLILAFLFLSLFVRFCFVDKFINVSGDLLLYADWGEKYWEYGSKDYYFIKQWYYAPPNYPPLINLYYAYAFKAFDYKFLFAQLHNFIKIPPAVFIVFYYKYGYFINLKLIGITCDILLGLLAYFSVLKLSKKPKIALLSGILYLFSPVGIVLSSIWGQTDSVIALLSIVSFILLLKKRFVLSSAFMISGLLFKPNWIIFIPLYLFILFLKKPKLNQLVQSFIVVILITLLVSLPFSDNPVEFMIWLINERIIPTLRNTPKLSISAFNIYTLFYQIDYHLQSQRLIGVPVKFIGEGIFLLIYLYCFLYLRKRKITPTDLFKVIFAVGLGSFIFMPGMLERYFFPAVIPFVIITSLSNKKIFILYLTFTLSFSLNLIWALFRRRYGLINDIFVDHNSFLIKILSLHNVLGYLILLRLLFRDNLLKLSLWKGKTA